METETSIRNVFYQHYYFFINEKVGQWATPGCASQQTQKQANVPSELNNLTHLYFVVKVQKVNGNICDIVKKANVGQ